MRKILFLLALLIPMLAGCGEDDNSAYMKTVNGKAGEVIVVLDKTNWDSEVGTTVRDILAKDYPMLPQKEPSFTLINIIQNAFSDLFKGHRNILYFNISNKITENGVFVKRDVWAQPQIVITVDAQDAAIADSLLKQNGDVIFSAIDQIEKERIARSSKKFEESSIRSVVAERFGGSPYFPKGYSIKKVADGFIWVSSEKTYINQGILIYTIPFDGVQFPSMETVIAEQNEVLKNNVPGMFPNSYMTTATAVTPIMTPYKYKDKSYVEIRGLWEVANDYMGGPFVEHVLYSKDPNKLLVIQGFVYAPRYKKRNLIRQVESVVTSFEWAENFQNK
ncbi:MAG: DUF4837 family protein [Bacteroidales bacterium]|nr:DUF4837 family protein [Bacteroidales bacterium]